MELQQKSPHVLFLAIIALTAVAAVYFSAFAQPYDAWADPANYQAAGMWMLQKGSFMPAELSYAEFLEKGTETFGLHVWDYPNYAYSLLQGVIGLARGEFSPLAGIWTAALSTLLIGFAAYAFLYSVLGDARISLLFSLGLLSHRLPLDVATKPATDILLLLLLLLALICTVRGKHLAAGFLMGLGYLFREQSLILVPFLPLLSPQSGTLRGLLRTGTITALGFLPALAVAYGLKIYFTAGQMQENFYLQHHRSWVYALLRPESAVHILKHFRSHLSRLGPMAWVALAYLLLRCRQTPPLARRMIVLAVVFSLIPCMLWVERPHIPNRYALYSVPLYLAALILCLRGHRHGTALVAALLLSATSLFAYKTIQANDSLQNLLSPGQAWARLERDLDAPKALRQNFASGSVFLGNRLGVIRLALDNPVLVQGPSFEEFMRCAGNERLDGIFIKRGADWPDRAELTDGHGVRFVRVELPQSLAAGHMCYKRVE